MRSRWNFYSAQAAAQCLRNPSDDRVVTSMEVSPRPFGSHDADNQVPPLPCRKLVDVRRWSQEKNGAPTRLMKTVFRRPWAKERNTASCSPRWPTWDGSASL